MLLRNISKKLQRSSTNLARLCLPIKPAIKGYYYSTNQSKTKQQPFQDKNQFKSIYLLFGITISVGCYFGTKSAFAQPLSTIDNSQQSQLPQQIAQIVSNSRLNIQDIPVLDFEQLENQIFNKNSNKMIFLVQTGDNATLLKDQIESQQLFLRFTQFASRIKGNLGVQSIIVPFSPQNKSKLLQVLNKRKQMTKKIDDDINGLNFLLVNQFNDWWFHHEELMKLQQYQIRMMYNYYLGLSQLTTLNNLLGLATDNSTNFITYVKDYKKAENFEKLKTMRTLHSLNVDSFLRKRFWVISDPKIAEQIGIKDQDQGAIFIARPRTIFNKSKQNEVKVKGFPFNMRKLISQSQIKQLPKSQAIAKIENQIFQNPIYIQSEMDWRAYQSKYAGVPLILAYCDPIQDPVTFQKMIIRMKQARQTIAPLDLTKSKEQHDKQKYPDLNFVLCSIKPNYYSQTNFQNGQPQLLYINPKNKISLLDDSKPEILRNGMSKDQFREEGAKMKQLSHQLAKNQNVSGKQQNEMLSKMAQYDENMYNFFEMYRMYDLQKMDVAQFIADIFSKYDGFQEEDGGDKGKLSQYWPSVKLRYYGFPTKYSTYVTGSDINKRVLERDDQSWVVLFYSSEKAKNLNFFLNFEAFSRRVDGYLGNDQASCKVRFGHFNINNRSKDFRAPSKPCIMIFKQGDKKRPFIYDLAYFKLRDPLQISSDRFLHFLIENNVVPKI